MSYYLFLDDERKPSNVTWIPMPNVLWTIVRNYDQFVSMIEERGIPEFISFDHDLADEHYVAYLEGRSDYGPEKTGYDCAKWLVDHCLEKEAPIPNYQVHSLNHIGRENINSYLENAKKHLGL